MADQEPHAKVRKLEDPAKEEGHAPSGAFEPAAGGAHEASHAPTAQQSSAPEQQQDQKQQQTQGQAEEGASRPTEKLNKRTVALHCGYIGTGFRGRLLQTSLNSC